MYQTFGSDTELLRRSDDYWPDLKEYVGHVVILKHAYRVVHPTLGCNKMVARTEGLPFLRAEFVWRGDFPEWQPLVSCMSKFEVRHSCAESLLKGKYTAASDAVGRRLMMSTFAGKLSQSHHR